DSASRPTAALGTPARSGVATMALRTCSVSPCPPGMTRSLAHETRRDPDTQQARRTGPVGGSDGVQKLRWRLPTFFAVFFLAILCRDFFCTPAAAVVPLADSVSAAFGSILFSA